MVPLSQNPRGRNLVIITAVFMALDFIGIYLRVYVRRIKRSRLELNDWAIITSVLLIFVHFIIEAMIVRNGLGLNDNEIREKWGGEPTLIQGRKLIFVVSQVYNFAVLTTKLSILHVYHVVFHPKKGFRKVVYAVMGASVAVCLSIFIAAFFQCKPLAAYWNPMIPGATCRNPGQLLTAAVITGTVLDLVIFALPIPILVKLKMRPKEKYGVIIAFTIGVVVCVIAVVRVYWTVTFDYTNTFYSIWLIALFGQLEPQLAAFSACIHVLPAIVKHFRGHELTQTKRSTNAGSSLQPPSNVTRSHNFERLTDSDIPLTTVGAGGAGTDRGSNESNIHVTTRIEVNTARVGGKEWVSV